MDFIGYQIKWSSVLKQKMKLKLEEIADKSGHCKGTKK